MPDLTIQLIDATNKQPVASVNIALSDATEQAIRLALTHLFEYTPLNLDMLFRSNPAGLADIQMGRNACFTLPVIQRTSPHPPSPPVAPSSAGAYHDHTRCLLAVREALDLAGQPVGVSLNADLYRDAIDHLSRQSHQSETAFQQIRLVLGQAGYAIESPTDIAAAIQSLHQAVQESQHQQQQWQEEADMAQENLTNLRDAYGELQTRLQMMQTEVQQLQEENQRLKQSSIVSQAEQTAPHKPSAPGAGRI